MNLAIIGSEGYLGSALQLSLKSLLKILPEHVCRIDSGLYGPTGYGVVHVDPLDTKGTIETLAMADPKVIVDLAALAHDPEKRIPVDLVLDVNARRAHLIARWAVETGRRYIVPSSLSIFAAGHDPYPESKRLLESQLNALGIHRGIDIVRFGTLFGMVPGLRVQAVRPHLLLNSMVLDTCLGRSITVGGNQHRPVTPLHDAVACLCDLIRGAMTGTAPGQLLNRYWISSDLWTWANTVKFMAETSFGFQGVEIKRIPSKDTRDYQFAPMWYEAGREIIDPLKACFRYTMIHRYELARWRKTQFKVLLGKLK